MRRHHSTIRRTSKSTEPLRSPKRSADAGAQPLLGGAVTADTTAGVQRIAGAINAEHALAQEEFLKHAIRCGELLLEQKQRVAYGTFGKWIEANCEFSVSTANNYMKVAKNPSALGKSGAIRRLYPSGFMDATKKTISKEKMAPTTDIPIPAAPRKASIGSTTGTPKLISQKERETATDAEIVTNSADSLKMPEVTIEVALNAIQTAVRAREMSFPACVAGLRAARGNVTLLRHKLTQAEQKLAETEGKVIETYQQMKQGARK